MMKTLFFTAIILFAGCAPSPENPEGLLRMYINDVTTKKVDKDYYLKYTTGELLDSAQDLEEEELAKRNFMEKVKKVTVDVLNKNCQEESCVLTYVVSYDTQKEGEEKASFSTETKKLAEFRKEEGKWKIAKVTSLKTFHDSLEPIDALEGEKP